MLPGHCVSLLTPSWHQTSLFLMEITFGLQRRRCSSWETILQLFPFCCLVIATVSPSRSGIQSCWQRLQQQNIIFLPVFPFYFPPSFSFFIPRDISFFFPPVFLLISTLYFLPIDPSLSQCPAPIWKEGEKQPKKQKFVYFSFLQFFPKAKVPFSQKLLVIVKVKDTTQCLFLIDSSSQRQ